jgi:hypothetical protein
VIDETVRLSERPGWIVKSRSRRLATVRIADGLFLRLFSPGTTYRIDGDPYPDDARIVGAEYSIFSASWLICLESEMFAEVPESEMPPDITPPSIHVTIERRD